MVSSNSKKTSNSIDATIARKILSTVPYAQGFHFFTTDGHYTGETATSLIVFSKDLSGIDIQSIRYHFDRGDFQKWIRTTIGDEELANRVGSLENNRSDEAILRELTEVLQKRLAELLELVKSP